MTSRLILLLMPVLVISFSCIKKKNCVAKPQENCFCTMQYDPVCGCDGKTYSNACVAECNGIKDHQPGECKK